jgi:UDP-N-acetylmuramoyl-L-alanyl-D-glutamate--2,6-diaminopimelate ligase
LRPEGTPPRTLAQVAERLGLPVPAGADAATSVTGVTHDSRAVRPGDLHAARPGPPAPGARAAGEARAAGAVAALTDADGAADVRAAGLPTLEVAQPRAWLGPLAAWVYGDPAGALTLVGVTGTNGKTTTAYLLEAGMRAAGRRTGLVGTIETRIAGERVPSHRTTPEAPELQALLAVMRERGVQAVAMEVSSHALAMGRVDGTTYEVGVFTNLTEDHLDFHRDLQDYFAAKASLFTPGRVRVAVVNVDDEYGRRLADEAAVPVVRVSPGDATPADWRVADLVAGPEGSRFRLLGPGGSSVEAGTALPGTFNVANAALAVVALAQAGLDPAVAAAGVAALPGVPGRMERVAHGQDFLALVDYAHSPDALERLLGAVRELAAGRVIVVVGCGGDRDPYKRPVMGAIAADLADVAILTSDNPRSEDPLAILAAMQAGAAGVAHRGTVEVVPDRRAAIERAVSLAGPADVVVVAGKGHEQGQEVRGELLPFDDRAVLRAAIGVPA